MISREASSTGATGLGPDSNGRGRCMDGCIWMPCPQTKDGLPCPFELFSILESCVAAPTRDVNDSTIAGSPRGSSATGAEVNASVSPPPVPLLCCSSQDPALQYRSPSRPEIRKRSLMHVLAQPAHRLSRVPPSKLDQQEDGPRSTGSMREVAGSASTEGRRPTRMLEVTVSSPEDRSTTIVRSRPSRPSLSEVIWFLVPSGSSILGSCPEFPSTVAVSSSKDRSTAGSRPSVAVSSSEDRSTAGV